MPFTVEFLTYGVSVGDGQAVSQEKNDAAVQGQASRTEEQQVESKKVSAGQTIQAVNFVLCPP